jgi:hypothetical protein
MSPEDIQDQAFAVIQNQFEYADWMTADCKEIAGHAGHIEEGFLDAERGDFIDGDHVTRMLDERHSPQRF